MKTYEAAKNSIAATFEKEKVFESGLYDDAELQTALAEQRRIDAMSPRNGQRNFFSFSLQLLHSKNFLWTEKGRNRATIKGKRLEH